MEISLIEFINKRKNELDRFAAQWMLNAQQEPEDWPLFLELVEWKEQEVMLFVTSGPDKEEQ